MPKINNKVVYPQDPQMSMEDYLIGSNYNTSQKKTQTYSLGSIFSLFYNFLGFNAFFNTTDTTTYPVPTPGCMYAYDNGDILSNDFDEIKKITFSSQDTYNFEAAEYFQIIINSGKFIFKFINLEDKNNFVYFTPSNFQLSVTGTSFDVDVTLFSNLSNGILENYKRYLLVLEFNPSGFNPDDYDLSDFTNNGINPFATIQDITNAISLLPSPITNHSELSLDDGSNPHGTTKNDVGLGNVDNTTDLGKPISTATQNALDLKQDQLVSGTNIKTLNGNSLLGTGNISVLDTNFISVATLPTTGIDQTKLYKLPDGSFNWYNGTDWNTFGLDKLTINNNVSGIYEIDFGIDTHRLTLTGNTTFTEVNLPIPNFSKTITLHVQGDYGLILPISWNTYLSGSYDGTAILNTIVIETFGTERKVQISQPD